MRYRRKAVNDGGAIHLGCPTPAQARPQPAGVACGRWRAGGDRSCSSRGSSCRQSKISPAQSPRGGTTPFDSVGSEAQCAATWTTFCLFKAFRLSREKQDSTPRRYRSGRVTGRSVDHGVDLPSELPFRIGDGTMPATCAFVHCHLPSLERHGIRVMAGSYESCLAALNDIIAQYRAGLARGGTRLALTRAEAVQRIKALGFTEGDATRWLDPKPRRPLGPR
jgi:hypothetical protein